MFDIDILYRDDGQLRIRRERQRRGRRKPSLQEEQSNGGRTERLFREASARRRSECGRPATRASQTEETDENTTTDRSGLCFRRPLPSERRLAPTAVGRTNRRSARLRSSVSAQKIALTHAAVSIVTW